MEKCIIKALINSKNKKVIDKYQKDSLLYESIPYELTD